MAVTTIPARHILKCDRCGLEADGDTVEGLKFRHPGGLDLCAPCQEALKEFMHGAAIPALEGRP